MKYNKEELINIFKRIIKDFIHFIPGIILCIAAFAVLNYLFNTVCYFRVLFGIPCPFCGITRALKLFMAGHIIKSIKMHPLLIFVIIGFIYYLFEKYFNNNSCKGLKVYVILTMSLFLIVYFIRMKLYFPYKEPMTYYKHNLIHIILNK